jgi:hypothetical protein
MIATQNLAAYGYSFAIPTSLSSGGGNSRVLKKADLIRKRLKVKRSRELLLLRRGKGYRNS